MFNLHVAVVFLCNLPYTDLQDVCAGPTVYNDLLRLSELEAHTPKGKHAEHDTAITFLTKKWKARGLRVETEPY